MNQIYIRGNEIATKAYVDSLSLGGDGSALDNYYTKEEVNNLIENNEGGNVNLDNYYTKEEINNVIAEINNTIQKEIMPDPSEDNVGTIIQYIGDTNEYYTNSHFYQVVEQTIINEDGTETIIYIWEEITSPEADLSNYYTKEEINNKGYITSSEANSTYVTQNNFNTLEKIVEDKANSSDVYTKEETDKAITDAIADVKTTDFQTATELPTENISTNTIYLITKEGEDGDIYEEYIYVNNKWEKIGETIVDLSQYSTTEEMNAAIAAEIAKIDLSKYLISTDAANTYATKTEVSNISNSVNNMYSKTEVNTAIETAINNITHPEVDLSNYYNKQEINDIIGDINAILDAINGEEV